MFETCYLKWHHSVNIGERNNYLVVFSTRNTEDRLMGWRYITLASGYNGQEDILESKYIPDLDLGC